MGELVDCNLVLNPSRRENETPVERYLSVSVFSPTTSQVINRYINVFDTESLRDDSTYAGSSLNGSEH